MIFLFVSKSNEPNHKCEPDYFFKFHQIVLTLGKKLNNN